MLDARKLCTGIVLAPIVTLSVWLLPFLYSDMTRLNLVSWNWFKVGVAASPNLENERSKLINDSVCFSAATRDVIFTLKPPLSASYAYVDSPFKPSETASPYEDEATKDEEDIFWALLVWIDDPVYMDKEVFDDVSIGLRAA